MKPLNATICLKEDFVSFNVVIDDLCDVVRGDHIRFSDDIKLEVVSKTIVALPVNGFNSGDTILELASINCHDIYEFYSHLEFFKSRYSFIGGFNTNQSEPHQPYKLFRLYRRFMHEEDEQSFKVVDTRIRFLSLVRFYSLFSIDYDMEHFEQFSVNNEIDLLELFIDFDNNSLIEFNVINSQFDILEDSFKEFRNL